MAPPTAAFTLRQPVLPPPVPLLPHPPAHYPPHPVPHAPPGSLHCPPPVPLPPNRPARPGLRLPPVAMKSTEPVAASQPTPGAKPTLICDGHDTTGENRNQPCQFYMTKRRWRCAFCRLYSPYRTHDGYEGKHCWA